MTVLIVDTLGRPLLTNAAHKMHPQAASKARRTWRDAFTVEARRLKVAHHDAITITTWPEYPDRRWMPDTDATAPSVKGAIDGLVLAGVIDNDTADIVRSVTYQAPRITPGCKPALVVQIEPWGLS